MKTQQELFKAISWRQIVVVFLAGFLLLITTACGTTKVDTALNSDRPNSTYSRQAAQVSKDATRSSNVTDARTNRLIHQGERNREKIQNPGDYVREVNPDNYLNPETRNLGQPTRWENELVEEPAKNVAKNARQGLRSLKDNVQGAVDQATDAVDRVTHPG